MKERPILFSAPMVRAILEGRKTMTRRVIKPQPDGWAQCSPNAPVVAYRNRGDDGWFVKKDEYFCPYGQPGDRLWVRESAYIADPGFGPPSDGGVRDNSGYLRTVGYAATMCADSVRCAKDFGVKLTPSIFMPRWASRILLEVTAVRVERVQDISEVDAKAEGLSEITKDGRLFKYGIPDRDGLPGTDNDGWPWSEWETDPRKAFCKLWNSINAERGYGWDANPWVWVIEFKKVKP